MVAGAQQLQCVVPDWSRWWRVPAGGAAPLDLMHARLVRNRFAAHLHDQFAIGVCSAGRESIRYRGETHHIGPGAVVVIEPTEVHTGQPAVDDGFTYRVMYPEPALLDHGVGVPHFATPMLDDPGLAARLAALHTALCRGLDPFEGESRLVELLSALVGRHATARRPRSGRGSPRASVARAVMQQLSDHLVDPPTLAELAGQLGLSRYQLARAFRGEVGLPPFAWLAQHRVQRARALLDRGTTPALAAAAVGFADQAHLTRWFRRTVGVTPGAYCNSVQDRGGGRPRP